MRDYPWAILMLIDKSAIFRKRDYE